MTDRSRPVDDVAPTSELGDDLQDLLALAPRVTHALSRRMGVTESHVEAMQHLVGEPLHPGELARRLGVTNAGATTIVDRLAASGHARRIPDSDDGRRVIVEATPRGVADVVDQLMPMLTRLSAMETGYSAQERAVIRRYLRDAAEALSLLADEPRQT